ncbi:hypothetical protein P2H44_12025 [Albimonas sp. CAU 1670]|uniref:hypothetical protein n=1 Tax=Albimonas sp. CAU 1670 TaxID=3032599 RepID=UPI0023DA969D|nr:hypothetical protein [Albimonas sp. CAU 1670]MDF2233280.1 hypothetical protein [Albimonas sp. CAU 1670]
MTLRSARAARTACGLAAAAFALALAPGVASPAAADSQEGYYYPPVTSEEEFDREMIDGPTADPLTRETFVTMITTAQLAAPENPRFAIFAKGDGSRRLIMVGLDDGSFKTLYRARAILAQMTYSLRNSPFFKDQGIEATATLFDVLQLMDFESLTITDGETWSHRVYFK